MSARPGQGIERKLLVSSVTVLASTLIGFLAIVILLNVSLSQRQKAAAVSSIRNTLLAKGQMLAANNALALSGMVGDNSFSGVASIIANTVSSDRDIVYGIYMDERRRPWAFADSLHPDGLVKSAYFLEDSLSIWASSVPGATHRWSHTAGVDVYEFAAPVMVDGRRMGSVRYGLTTALMENAIAAAAAEARQSLVKMLGALVMLGTLAIGLAYLAARRQAKRITRPIEALQTAANAIARGDYARPLEVTGEDEIALLAADFDSMRRTVKDYTERLEEMVQDKIREIKDILDHIEQGLFTIGLDGKVNPDYALSTNAVLGVADVSKKSLAELLHLDAAALSEWMDWFAMVKSKHRSLRWEKILRVCPVRELRLDGADGRERTVIVGYQKMLNHDERLEKLMILVQDVTESRRVEQAIRDQKQRHEDEVKAILGMVRYGESIPEFLDDLEERIQRMSVAADSLSTAEVGAYRSLVQSLSRDLHTLKGTSATYGFEALARVMRMAEEWLVARPGGSMDTNPWSGFQAFLMDMRSEQSRLLGLRGEMARGGPDAVSIADHRLAELRALARALEPKTSASVLGSGTGGDDGLRRLLRACRDLDSIPLGRWAEKYRRMVGRLGESLGKRLELKVEPEGLEISPRMFAALDEPLVHMIRNAADHGIETDAERSALGKSPCGKITIRIEERQGNLDVTVSDDGAGIDPDHVASQALAKGLVSVETLSRLGESDRQKLIFLPGFSTRDSATEISGRGVGMHAVVKWAEERGGTVDVDSLPGQGARITLRLPSGLHD